jgi:hypothetical protein
LDKRDRGQRACAGAATGLLRPRETAALANLQRDHPVAPELRPYVERYWSVSWALPEGSTHRSEVLPAPAVNVSVETGDRPRFGADLPAVLVHGVVTRRFTVDLCGTGRVTAVKFRPGGFTAFTGVRAGRDRVAALGPELGVDARTVLDVVLAGDDDAARAAALDAVLAPHAPDPEPAYLELVAVLDQMQDRTLVRVEDVAAGADTTVRSLQRLFTRYVGVGCKAVLARYRLQDAVGAIDAGDVRRPRHPRRLARLVRPGALQPRVPRAGRHDPVGLPAAGPLTRAPVSRSPGDVTAPAGETSGRYARDRADHRPHRHVVRAPEHLHGADARVGEPRRLHRRRRAVLRLLPRAHRSGPPGRDEIIESQSSDWREVAHALTDEPLPAGARVQYQKHMTHHLLPEVDRAALDGLRHAFLVREPAEVLVSYARVRGEPTLEDLGLPQQVELFERFGGPVVDARAVLEAPGPVLSRLCEALDVAYDEAMLTWPPGPRETDGVWAPHWYSRVWASTGFEPYRPPTEPVPDRLLPLLERAQPCYDALAPYAL